MTISRRPLPRLLLWLLLLVPLLVTAPAGAQSEADKTTARQLSIEAQKALVDGDFETAADKFRRAEELFHAPTLLLGMARAYKGLGRYVESLEAYNRVVRERLDDSASDAFRKAVEDAKSEIGDVEAKLAWVVVTVEGPDEPIVTLDGHDIPMASLGVKRAIDPGSHQVQAGADGWAPSSQSFDVASGDVESVTLSLQEDPNAVAPPPVDPGATPTSEDDGTLTTVGWIGVGVGGAGLVLGAITGGLAIGKHGELEDACAPDGACAPDQQGTLDDYELMGTLSTVGFIAGGVLAATGATLLIIDSLDDGTEEGVSVRVGPTRASLTLRF